MNFQLRSPKIHFELVFPGGSWGSNPVELPSPRLRSAPLALTWHDDRNRFLWVADAVPCDVSDNQNLHTSLGDCHFLGMDWDSESDNLSKRVEYALSTHHSAIQWRFHISNRTRKKVYLDRITMLHTGIIGPRLSWTSEPFTSLLQSRKQPAIGLWFERKDPEFAFFSNGWQSWNYAGTLGMDDPFPWSRLGPLDKPIRMNSGTPKPKRRGHFLSDFFAVFADRKSRQGLILGFLSQRQLFGIIEGWVHPADPTLRMWTELDGVSLEPNQTFTTDWAYLEFINLETEDPLSGYFKAVARENGVERFQNSQTGWCSWYHAFESVSERLMMNNLSWIEKNRSRIPLQVVQLDDGYESQVGDWFSWKETFPNGIQSISKAIHEANFIPGIWIAPFIAKRLSKIAHEKPEWILRNQLGLAVNVGFLWNSFPYALDVTHPGVIEHVQNLITRYIQEMGFDYLKLDFLYAGALRGKRHNPSLTRAQGFFQVLQRIRDVAGPKIEILGCGCPLGSGISIFDRMRIGPDVAPTWKPSFKGIEAFISEEKGMPATKNSILTTINRMPMHQRWWINDPDCLLIRSKDTQLSEAEVQTLASVIAMSGGAMIVSDDLPTLDEERVDWLARLLPPLPKAAFALDWFDTTYPSRLKMDLEGEVGSWTLIAIINWEDHPADVVLHFNDFHLDTFSSYHLIDFWNECYAQSSSEEIAFKGIPAHGIRMLSLRKVSHEPQWLGDTLHISQGLIVKDWKLKSDQLNVGFDLKREAKGKAWIALRNSPQDVSLEGKQIPWKEIAPGIIELSLEMSGKAYLQVTW